ncbi:MAG: cytochrome C [Ferruginibacter sp.]
MQFLKSYWWIGLIMIIVVAAAIILIPSDLGKYNGPESKISGTEWIIPDMNRLPATPEGDLIRYGKALVSNTAFYLGPKGTVAHITNGMNCQNCHLDAGTRLYGNNYSAVSSTYPKFRARSGTIETIFKRVNDCIERSLNGTALDSNSREMKAIYAYICWLGTNVPKNVKPIGTGIAEISLPQEAADPVAGKIVFTAKCSKCHAADGCGLFNADSSGYTYPPLWGIHSFTTGAGLYRLSRFAGYVKFNMPFDKDLTKDTLTTEEAWNVAAFVNSQPRPDKRFAGDWPDVSSKPFDYPFGPYKDSFSEQQHKYGPWTAMLKQR